MRWKLGYFKVNRNLINTNAIKLENRTFGILREKRGKLGNLRREKVKGETFRILYYNFYVKPIIPKKKPPSPNHQSMLSANFHNFLRRIKEWSCTTATFTRRYRTFTLRSWRRHSRDVLARDARSV